MMPQKSTGEIASNTFAILNNFPNSWKCDSLFGLMQGCGGGPRVAVSRPPASSSWKAAAGVTLARPLSCVGPSSQPPSTGMGDGGPPSQSPPSPSSTAFPCSSSPSSRVSGHRENHQLESERTASPRGGGGFVWLG